MKFQFDPIGKVNSTYLQKFGTPRQPGLVKNARAFIELNPSCQPELSLEGLSAFSHLWIIFVFHRNDNLRFRAKVDTPRLQGDTMGLFATRSPHRPNPIGLSLVEIEKVQANGVWVRGADLMDGTPVLDIKPYLPDVEARPDANAGWSDGLTAPKVAVEWIEQAEQKLNGNSHLREIIEQTVSLDPRPQVYKGEGGAESRHRESHVMRIEGIDVHFYFKNREHVVVLDLVDDPPDL